MIDDVGFLGGAEGDLGCDRGLPATAGRASGDRDGSDTRGRVFVAERDADGGRSNVDRNLHHEEFVVRDEFGRAADGDSRLDFLGRALVAGADDEEEVLPVGGDGQMALDDDMAVVFGSLPEFANRGVGNAIGQDDVLADEFDGLELAERGRDRAAADFLGRRGGGAWVGVVDLCAELPARNDRVAEPKFAFGLRGGELAAEGLAAGVVIGAWSEGLIADAFAAPDGGDAEQVGVEAGPRVMRQLDDDPARREVVFAESVATCVEDGREEREVGLDPGAPGLRLVLSRLFRRLGR